MQQQQQQQWQWRKADGRGHRIHYARQIIDPAAPVACVIFDSPVRTL